VADGRGFGELLDASIKAWLGPCWPDSSTTMLLK
jgi:hypothetical protein